jgi:hypothetical protein
MLLLLLLPCSPQRTFSQVAKSEFEADLTIPCDASGKQVSLVSDFAIMQVSNLAAALVLHLSCGASMKLFSSALVVQKPSISANMSASVAVS